jgi:23S rRNA pseudouridine1911/1915/1917 synthase
MREQPLVLFEDPNLIVISKPAGLLSQGEHTGDENVVDWLRDRVGREYVGLVHRLDRNTSGAMVVAKRTKAAQRLTEALTKGELKRVYVAWLKGSLRSQARWEHSLSKDERTNTVRVVKGGSGKTAVLVVKPLRETVWKGIPLTLAEFTLETGRSHQIRVQSAFEGFPLLGDRKYGKSNDPFTRPALHSSRVEFPHPISREILSFVAPLPSDLSQVEPEKPNP